MSLKIIISLLLLECDIYTGHNIKALGQYHHNSSIFNICGQAITESVNSYHMYRYFCYCNSIIKAFQNRFVHKNNANISCQ